jgi:hypothetical protein
VVFDAIRDSAVETDAAVMYLKRRSLTLEDIYLAGQQPAQAAHSEASK